MALNASEIVVAQNGSINVAEYGTQLPTDMSALDASTWVNLGYVGANGVTFTATPSVTDITSWQAATPTRKLVTARALTVAWTGQQWNLETFRLAFGGGDFSPLGDGDFRYDPPRDTDALVDYSIVIDAQDGDNNYRWIVRRGNVTDAVAVNLTRTAVADLPITFTALAPDDNTPSWYFLTDSVYLSYMS